MSRLYGTLNNGSAGDSRTAAQISVLYSPTTDTFWLSIDADDLHETIELAT